MCELKENVRWGNRQQASKQREDYGNITKSKVSNLSVKTFLFMIYFMEMDSYFIIRNQLPDF